MLSSPLGQDILNYEPPHGFAITPFAMYDGSSDPYDHMLHLEISEKERHHEVLLTVKNLHDLSRHPSPYNIPIIPCPVPSKVVEGEHFVVVDLLSLIPGSSSPVVEAESEAAGRELVINTQPVQPSSTSEDSGPAPHASRQVEGGSRDTNLVKGKTTCKLNKPRQALPSHSRL